MLKFLLRRLVNYVVLVFIATTLAYLLASVALNPRSNFEGRNPPAPQAVIDQQLTDLGINNKDPLLSRYAHWAGGVVTGDFGKTVTNGSVNDEMGRRIGVSLRLLLIGSILGTVVGVLAGVISAVRQYKATDHILTFASFLVLSTPVFLLAILLKLYGVKLNNLFGHNVLSNTGEYEPRLAGAGFWVSFGDRLSHLVLPTLAIALGAIAFYSRYQRNAMLDVLGSDFLRTAQAKGLRRRQALFKHGLRTALIPMATFFAFQFGTLVIGATFTEKIFSWHGMGEWFVDSITTNDVNAVAAVTLFVAVCILVSGMLSDIVYAALDPRIRVS